MFNPVQTEDLFFSFFFFFFFSFLYTGIICLRLTMVYFFPSPFTCCQLLRYVILFINLFACSSLTGRGYTGPTTLIYHPVARGLPNILYMLQRCVCVCVSVSVCLFVCTRVCIINMHTVA